MTGAVHHSASSAGKTLGELGLAAGHDRGLRITGLCISSHEVAPGNLFAALPGLNVHGAAFSEEAIARGAAAILTDRPGTEKVRAADGAGRIRIITVDDPRPCLAMLAAEWFDRAPEVAVAVTGTNGKSSVAGMCRQIWELLGRNSASLGTIGIEGGLSASLPHTTPDPIALHGWLAELHDAGVTHLALEASSHGLRQHRLAGVGIVAAAFTNLTHDHLDYHADMEEYFDAKSMLFTRILPVSGTAVIWTDTGEGRRMAELASRRAGGLVTLGGPESDLQILSQRPHQGGQDLKFGWKGRRYGVCLPLPGSFQARNVLTAAALVAAAGEDVDEVMSVLDGLQTVRGRLELAAARKNGAQIFVDYAHTPHALQTVISSLRPHVLGRMVVVFGAGGERDAAKREQMGQIVAELADVAIVTDDNPRREDPTGIRAAILAACPSGIEIPDRAEAILRGADMLEVGDVLLIAGKGHESGQDVGGVIHPFDDVEQASMSVRALDGMAL